MTIKPARGIPPEPNPGVPQLQRNGGTGGDHYPANGGIGASSISSDRLVR